jgi:hypothetical protein
MEVQKGVLLRKTLFGRIRNPPTKGESPLKNHFLAFALAIFGRTPALQRIQPNRQSSIGEVNNTLRRVFRFVYPFPLASRLQLTLGEARQAAQRRDGFVYYLVYI